jgi:hypothetical protein
MKCIVFGVYAFTSAALVIKKIKIGQHKEIATATSTICFDKWVNCFEKEKNVK